MDEHLAPLLYVLLDELDGRVHIRKGRLGMIYGGQVQLLDALRNNARFNHSSILSTF